MFDRRRRRLYAAQRFNSASPIFYRKRTLDKSKYLRLLFGAASIWVHRRDKLDYITEIKPEGNITSNP
jgi:hypothetical protein